MLQNKKTTMNDLITSSELQKHFSNEAFVLKTQQQIAKDFEKFHLSFAESFLDAALPKPEIETLIAERISALMEEGETRLLQLLYTIDLPEKEFLVLTTEPNFLQLLSEKILFREAYKVFLRSRF
jgi:hypothetical protein